MKTWQQSATLELDNSLWFKFHQNNPIFDWYDTKTYGDGDDANTDNDYHCHDDHEDDDDDNGNDDGAVTWAPLAPLWTM